MNTRLLYSKATQKLILRDKVDQAIHSDTELPAFQKTTDQLIRLLQSPESSISQIAEVARLDPGITSKILKIACSPVFGGRNISSIEEAVMLVGADEIRKIASAILIINQFAKLRIKVDWHLFWLHSVLTARITECFANAYMELTGREYLAGLIHDIGKLYLEHYFPKEFELVILLSVIANRGMYDAERQLLDITHAEVGGILCQEWKLDNEIVRAVTYHHEPILAVHEQHEDSLLLPLSVCLANKLANLCHANIQGGENLDNIEFESLPEWKRLKQFKPRTTLILDVQGELKKAQELINLAAVAV